MTQRTQRVDELIRQEIGEIIARELSDPRIGFVTITDVETTQDLSHAKVWASFMGTSAERAIALSALGHAMPFIRRELGTRLRIRRVPELHLQADDTLARGTRVLQLINDLGAGADPSSVPVTEDSLPTPVPRLPHEGDAPGPSIDDASRTASHVGDGKTGPMSRRRRPGNGPVQLRKSTPRQRRGRP